MQRYFRAVGLFVLVLCAAIALSGCGKRGNGKSNPPTRPFHMGFTSWPYAATIPAVDDTWTKIHAHGDMITIHIDQGVPWPEAYAGTAYPSKVEAELQNYTNHIASDKEIFLQVSCLDNMRQNLGGYWNNSGGNQPRPGAWAGYTFANQEIADAYVNWMKDLIDRYNPTYVCYGVEVGDLALQDPAEWANFPVFAQRVYTALKLAYPSLPFMVSLSMKTPGSAEMTTTAAAFNQIKNYTDVVGVSIYPYAFFTYAGAGDPANLPATWLSQAQALAPSKPIAITETAWIGQTMDIPAFSLHVEATPANQNDYLKKLFAECNKRNALFISWFDIVDFDDL
ncbi:MAG TPA: hypothetical protein VL860_02075, partial [Planctomycetota bacterium]|nr:hypothetical protein [Planctomycetota bacterium]